MNIKINKYKKKIFILNKFIPFTLIIILLLLTKLSFPPKPKFISQRKLESNEPFQGKRKNDAIITDNKYEELVFNIVLIFGFAIYCFMAIYVLVRLNTFPDDIKNRRYDLYIFIYFGNNGTLIASFFNIVIFFNPYSESLNRISGFLLFYLTAIIFIIGGICFIINLFINKCIPEEVFSWEHLSSIIKFPCFVWNLITLDDCSCMCTTSYYNADNQSGSSSCCAYICNLFFKFLKFISYLYCIISFYIFYIVFVIGWLITKLICLIVLFFLKDLCCRKNENENVNNISQNSKKQGGDQGGVKTIIVKRKKNKISPIEPRHKQNVDINDENIFQERNSSSNRDLSRSKQSQEKPASIQVDNENKNSINEPSINSDKKSDKDDKDDDIAFQYLNYGK